MAAQSDTPGRVGWLLSYNAQLGRHRIAYRGVGGLFGRNGSEDEVSLIYGWTWGSESSWWTLSTGVSAIGTFGNTESGVPLILDWMARGGWYGIGAQAYTQLHRRHRVMGVAVMLHVGWIGGR